MYNDKIRKSIISDLENKAMDVVKTSIALASQGYLVNRKKYIKLDWTSLLLSAFENIDILSDEQQHNIELLYNKMTSL